MAEAELCRRRGRNPYREDVSAHPVRLFPAWIISGPTFPTAPSAFTQQSRCPTMGSAQMSPLRPRRGHLFPGSASAMQMAQPERSGFQTTFRRARIFHRRRSWAGTRVSWTAVPELPYSDYHMTRSGMRISGKRPACPRRLGRTRCPPFGVLGRWHPFLRYSYAEGERGGATPVEHLVTTGSSGRRYFWP